jgi:hypothetical protein
MAAPRSRPSVTPSLLPPAAGALLRAGGAAVVVAAVFLAGCGAGPQSPLEPAEPVLDAEGAPPGAEQPAGAARSDAAAEPSPAAPPPPPSPEEPDPSAKFREITPRECQALAGKYGELTRSDETAKLNPKLTDKQRAQAAESIEAAARTLESRWAESCSSSLLGKVAEEEAITCAMHAENVAAFDTCLNGPK